MVKALLFAAALLATACVGSSSGGAASTSAAATDTGAADAVAGSDTAAAAETAGSSCTETATSKSKTGKLAAALCDTPLTAKGGIEFSADVKISDATSGVGMAGLDFTVAFIHVSMGHGGSKIPAVEDVGGGRYKVTKLQATASMKGAWRLDLKTKDDTVSFTFTIN